MNFLLKLIAGNPLVLLYAAAAIAIGAAGAAGYAAWTVQGWRLDAVKAEYKGFKDTTEALGKIAKRDADAVLARQKRTITQTRSKYETDMAAVHEYWAGRLRDSPCPGGSGMPASDSDPKRTDAPASQSALVGSLEACARDALTLYSLQEFLRANGHSVQ